MCLFIRIIIVRKGNPPQRGSSFNKRHGAVEFFFENILQCRTRSFLGDHTEVVLLNVTNIHEEKMDIDNILTGYPPLENLQFLCQEQNPVISNRIPVNHYPDIIVGILCLAQTPHRTDGEEAFYLTISRHIILNITKRDPG